jgi:hypothetical protein
LEITYKNNYVYEGCLKKKEVIETHENPMDMIMKTLCENCENGD